MDNRLIGTPCISLGRTLCAYLALTFLPVSAEDTLAPYLVEADRVARWPSSEGYQGESLSRERLARQPGALVGDRLLGRGGFRLFRRQSSLAAHPTTQGAALRVAGPNAAARTTVYLDGVPLNDAFGGWVPWSELNALAIDQTSLVQASGVDPWGQVSLGGAVGFESRLDAPYWSMEASWGNVVDHQLAQAFLLSSSSGNTRIFGNWSRVQSDGYRLLSSRQSGSIDRKATLESSAAQLGMAHDFASAWTLTTAARFHEEKRGNGTPLARNSQKAWSARATLQKERAGDEWEGFLTAYWQHRAFDSTFTRVTDQRRSELPVLDQYDVPSWSAGLTWRSQHTLTDKHILTFGLDTRVLKGETNEFYRNLGDGFTRRRRAGGERWESGIVVDHSWQISPSVSVKNSVRIDHHHDRDGEEQTWDLLSGDRLSDMAYDAQSEWQVNARMGIEWEMDPAWTWQGSLFTGTRRPTLNELYRPFRVGNDITLANAQLKSERLWGGSMGFSWEPHEHLRAQIDGFWYRLEDGIANVTMVEGGGVVDPWGFIPAGGSGRQRRGLAETDLFGFEAMARWQFREGWEIEASYLLSESNVHRSPEAPQLEGNSLAHAPTQQASIRLHYDAGAGLYAQIEGRWTDGVFEDDRNERRLADILLVNAHLGWRWSENVTSFLSVENLLDEEIDVGRSGDGLLTLGAPRMVRLGLRLDF